MQELINQIINNPQASLIIVGNLIILEGLLSVDNAAVLATMVMDLPKKERVKALKYGIWGAYLFRGLAMLFASVLIKIWWLKVIGGLYLIYLVYRYWKEKNQAKKNEELNILEKKKGRIFEMVSKFIGPFWTTIFFVEAMDMAFSIDNVFVAVAFSNNIILVCLGVFIGILVMRFIAQWFVKLMTKYSFLSDSAFIIIGFLGLKLLLSIFQQFYPQTIISTILSSHEMDTFVSLLTIMIFFVPIITSVMFDFPRHNQKEDKV